MSMNILKGLHRRVLGIGYRDELVSVAGYVSGGDNRPAIVLPGNPDMVAIFDDFLGDLVADEWAAVKSDTGMATPAIANVTNGVFRLAGSETQPPTAEGNAALTQGLFKQWKADMGGRKNGRLRMGVRLKSSVISTAAEGGRVHLFAGLSDSGGAEVPAYDTGAGVISQAADMVGFMYSPSSAANTDRWQMVAVKSTAGDSGDQLAVPATAIGPVSNTYTTLEVEVRNGLGDTGGCAHFWIDGKKVGTLNSPVGSNIALTPWVGGWVQDTGVALQVDLDWLAVSAPRDTGE